MEIASSKEFNNPKEPLVSLIILTYDRLDYLKETIASAVSQTYRNMEIIVSDNDSQINPAALVASFEDSRLRLRRNPTNIGQTRNYLAAVKEAKGKYVTFLHDDDKFHPEFISTMVAAMEADPQVVLAFSDISFIDADGHILHEASENATRVFKKDLAPGKHQPFHRAGLVDRTISGMDTLFRREAINWNDLPADLPACSDFYMVYLFARTNQAAYFSPERLCFNRIHAGQQTVTSTFPRGMVRCYEHFLADPDLDEFKQVFRHDLALSEAFLGIALLKERNPREARLYLKKSLRLRFNLRALASLFLSFIPFQMELIALSLYKRVKKILHIKNEYKFTN